MPSPADLPIEIVLAIIEQAAYAYVGTDRSWVAQLAVVSRATCAIVRPILFSTLVITNDNEHHFEELGKAITRILPLVRSLHVVNYDTECGNVLDTANEVLDLWKPKISHLSAPWPMVKDFCRRLDEAGAGGNALTSISISYEKLAVAIVSQGLPKDILGSLRRIDGYVPTAWATGNLIVSPTSWTHAILDALPNLTHFGLRLVGFDSRRSLCQDPIAEQRIATDIQTVVAAALRHRPTLELIVLLVGGNYVDMRKSLERELLEFGKTGRFRIVYDHRLSSWDDETQVELGDAWARRTIWNASSEILYPLRGPGISQEQELRAERIVAEEGEDDDD